MNNTIYLIQALKVRLNEFFIILDQNKKYSSDDINYLYYDIFENITRIELEIKKLEQTKK